MNKKIVTLLMTVLMLSLLTACGKSEDKASNGSALSYPTPASTQSSDQATTNGSDSKATQDQGQTQNGQTGTQNGQAGPAQEMGAKIGKSIDTGVEKAKQGIQKVTAPGGPIDQATDKMQQGVDAATQEVHEGLSNGQTNGQTTQQPANGGNATQQGTPSTPGGNATQQPSTTSDQTTDGSNQ